MSVFSKHIIASHLSLFHLYSIFLEPFLSYFFIQLSLPDYGDVVLGARSETSRESTVRSNLVGNAGSRPISEAKQPWACPVLGWGTTGEAHVLYSFSSNFFSVAIRTLRSARSSISDTVSFPAIPKYFEGSVPCSRSTLNTSSSVFL